MSSLQAILESINGSLKTTLESVSKLENLYEEGQEDKSNRFESFFDSKDKSSSSSKERVSLLSLKNGAILSYVQSLLMIAHDKMDPDCRDPTGDKGRQLAIENRVVLERGVKPLEKKLSYQLDKFQFIEQFTTRIIQLSFRASAHTGVGIPRLEGKCNEKCRKSYGIATPVCGLVRNDILNGGNEYELQQEVY